MAALFLSLTDILQVEEKTQALALEVKEAEEGLRGTLNQIPSLAADYLHHDDSHLQTLTAISAIDAGHGNDLRERVTQLTEKLSQLDREAIECRLNRVYLQQLARPDADRCSEQSKLLEHEVEKDLKSLHVEIPDVAIMAVAQCFKTPLLQALAEKQREKDGQARRQLEDVGALDNCASMLAILELTVTGQPWYDCSYRGSRGFCGSS